MKPFALTISKSQNIDKPSLLELIQKVFYDAYTHYTDIPFHYHELNESIKNQLILYLQSKAISIPESKVTEAKEKAITKMKENEAGHVSLIDELTCLLFTPQQMHWKFSSMTLSFLDLFITLHLPLDPRISKYVTENLVGEHPTIRRVCLSFLNRIMVLVKKRSPQFKQYSFKQSLESVGLEDFKVRFSLNGMTAIATSDAWKSE